MSCGYWVGVATLCVRDKALFKHRFDDVRAVNPKLVYCSITGFGQTGPRAQHAAYDVPIAAMGGLLSITGHPDGPPAKVRRATWGWAWHSVAHVCVLFFVSLWLVAAGRCVD